MDFHKALYMKDLNQITVIGLGLLGGSISLAVLRSFAKVKVIGYAHRASTRDKAEQLAVASEVVSDMCQSVSGSDLVILATPLCTFENIFDEIAVALPSGCIVTDVGSTKVFPHRWAAKKLPGSAHYVGSHPIVGSEQRGIEFARDDLFVQTVCILTTTERTNRRAVQILKKFWSHLGCFVKTMKPADHDRIFANVSHLPHITAAALINANNSEGLKFAGKGFMDTSRVASGPANVWADVLLTNKNNMLRGIDKIIAELTKFKKAIKGENKGKIEKLLEKARDKRTELINYKIKNKEMIS
jgi:prephenate dehydrogenase